MRHDAGETPHMTERERLRLRLRRQDDRAPLQSERDRLREARASRLRERLGVPDDVAAVLTVPPPPAARPPLSPTLLALASRDATPLPPSVPSPTTP